MKTNEEENKELDLSFLRESDWKFLESHGFAENHQFHSELTVYGDKENKKVFIKTHPRTWRAMCGREWEYDCDTKKLELICMN